MNPAWISITTAVGAFTVSGLSIFFGYRLFLLQATGAFTFTGSVKDMKVELAAAVPGVAFAGFGMFIAIVAVNRLMGKK